MDVDLRDGPASDMGNTSATTFAGKVVGDSITESIDVELYGLFGLKWMAGRSGLKGRVTSKTRYANL